MILFRKDLMWQMMPEQVGGSSEVAVIMDRKAWLTAIRFSRSVSMNCSWARSRRSLSMAATTSSLVISSSGIVLW